MLASRRLFRQIRGYYNECGHDYVEFTDYLEELFDEGKINSSEKQDLMQRFPNTTAPPPTPLDSEEDVEVYLKNPPDLDPLRNLRFQSWVGDVDHLLRVSMDTMRKLLGFGEEDVLEDIQENALHILDGCNNPMDNGMNWGKNRRGLVYGMVQSGKTASMLALINAGKRAGYRLFIILAGDKSSLRDQTQKRVNDAFGLGRNGVNQSDRIFSPTVKSDFRQTSGGYSANFSLDQHVIRNQDWTTIIVMKKETNHLNSIISQFEDLKRVCPEYGKDAATLYPAMIIDDEADYASQNTDVRGDGTTIHNDILKLRKTIPRNCYVAYTATPQANFSADIDDEIGYPKDFWWMIEPFQDRDDSGIYRFRTYLGSYQVFYDYEPYLLHKMGRNEWPHHEKKANGKPHRDGSVYYPSTEYEGVGYHTSGMRDLELAFLQEIVNKERKIPPSIYSSIADYIITCGVRWWRDWCKTGESVKPSKRAIERGIEYKFHAMMVHLSLNKLHQEIIREIVQDSWPEVISQFENFNPEDDDESNIFSSRWKLQVERTTYFRKSSYLPFSEIKYFMMKCIEITTEPIYNHRNNSPYSYYEQSPWIYLLNSSDDGMELNYSETVDWQVRAKKSLIIVGGNILSRGLTINGLSVTLFGRTSGEEMMDTVLQRGRWFGHKMKEADLISIHLQDESKEIFRQIAEADRYLRLQIKQALYNGFTPMEVLIELRNSPFLQPTAKKKRSFLTQGNGFGFSGKRALLISPSFEISDIQHNENIINDMLANYVRTPVLNRGKIGKNIDPQYLIEKFKLLKCDKSAPHVSFSVYADYLQDWLDDFIAGRCSELPRINVVIMDGIAKRQRQLRTTSYPSSVEQVIDEVTPKFGPIVGGMNDPKTYMGDAFLDYSNDWHLATDSTDKVRKAGDDILIVIYRLDSNYIRKSFYDESLRDEDNPNGKLIKGEIRVPNNHELYIPGDLPVYAFAAWTPIGGPMYDIGYNRLINPDEVKQRGLNISESVTEGDLIEE